MDIEILGKSYPMAYTIDAQNKINEKAGGIDKIELLFDGNDPVESMQNILFMAAQMIKGAADRERLKNKLIGNEVESSVVPTYEDLSAVIEVKEIKQISQAVMKTIQEGSRITVEVEDIEKKTK